MSERRRTGRRPGTSDSRARILAAARDRFAERGYDAATIRQIAADAGVDPALVHHYFGTKQRLFVAAIELPAELSTFAPFLLDGPADRLGERLARFVVGMWEQPQNLALIRALVRSASTDPLAAGILRRLLVEGPFLALTRAIDRPDADLRAALAGTQLIGLAMARYIVRVEPLASASAEALVALVGPTLQRYLVGDLSDPTGSMGASRRGASPPAAAR